VLLQNYGPRLAFGMPAAMMFVATAIFWAGRRRFAVVPPAGRQWLKDVLSLDGLRLIGSLLIIYFFVALFWSLWDQSNGQTWTLQATSDLMDKNIGFGFTLLPAQVQVVNGLLILVMVPIFTFGVYPLLGRLFEVTPLRKIGMGLFVIAASFLIVSWIEQRIQSGLRVSVWWQIWAYVVLTASEVLVSITALEFSYKQAPLRMKSFIMALFLLSISFGNALTALVNGAMVLPLTPSRVEAGAQTWVEVPSGTHFVVGQKIDFSGHTGLTVLSEAGRGEDLAGTYLAAEVVGNRIRLMDNAHRRPFASTGTWDAGHGQVSTYRLVGPQYFNFFAYGIGGFALLFILVAMLYRERTYVRTDAAESAPA
jgi:proton-dependent oligopeptide transporter, POT family